MANASYRTKQKELVRACLQAHADAFLSVDDVCALLETDGAHIGRTTVYRALERAAATGEASKVAGVEGKAAHYRAHGVEEATDAGQLSCLECGRVIPLDCTMLQEFAQHVENHHGFAIDRRRTVLYGLCAACAARRAQAPTRNGAQR